MKISIKNVFKDLVKKQARTKMDELEKAWGEMDDGAKEKALRQTNISKTYQNMDLNQMPMNVVNKVTAWICSEFFAPGHPFYRHEPRITRSATLTVDQAYEKAKVLQRGRILSQESYEIITNQLKETDLYPFTTKLVSVGIRVASKQKTKSECLFNRFFNKESENVEAFDYKCNSCGYKWRVYDVILSAPMCPECKSFDVTKVKV